MSIPRFRWTTDDVQFSFAADDAITAERDDETFPIISWVCAAVFDPIPIIPDSEVAGIILGTATE